MNKTAFIKRVAEQHKKEHITKRVYTQVLQELLAGIQSELVAGRKVSFLGFGTFYTRIYKGRTGLNFKTKKPVAYKDIRITGFRAGTLLKRAVRKKK
jgi:DNA-binding protein HU-beta